MKNVVVFSYFFGHFRTFAQKCMPRLLLGAAGEGNRCDGRTEDGRAPAGPAAGDGPVAAALSPTPRAYVALVTEVHPVRSDGYGPLTPILPELMCEHFQWKSMKS